MVYKVYTAVLYMQKDNDGCKNRLYNSQILSSGNMEYLIQKPKYKYILEKFVYEGMVKGGQVSPEPK